MVLLHEYLSWGSVAFLPKIFCGDAGTKCFYGSLTIGDKAVHQKVWQRQLSHRQMSSLRNRTSVTGLICTASRNPG